MPNPERYDEKEDKLYADLRRPIAF